MSCQIPVLSWSSSPSIHSISSTTMPPLKKTTKVVKPAIKNGEAIAICPLKKARVTFASSREELVKILGKLFPNWCNRFLIYIYIDAEHSLSPSQEDNAETDEQELGAYDFAFHIFFVSNHVIVEHLQVSWHSSVYGFFEAKVSIGYNEGQKFHFFKCASKNCKGKGQKVFGTTWTQRIALQCPISRIMHLDALSRSGRVRIQK